MTEHTDQPDLTASRDPTPSLGRDRRLSRRSALKRLGALGAAATSLGSLESLSWTPDRVEAAAPSHLSDIQFDIGGALPPARHINDILIGMPPVYTVFLTATIGRSGPPSREDQTILAHALGLIESNYPATPAGVFLHIAYGIPYFKRLPGGMAPSGVAASHLPVFHTTLEPALQEAIPGPTDVSPQNPTISKKTFHVPVQIEGNDVLFTLRSDRLSNLSEVARWLKGSNTLGGRHLPSPPFRGLLRFTSTRVMFAQIGMPTKVAQKHQLPYAGRINPNSPMWMGFFSQQVNGFGPVDIATFQGNESARFTGMRQSASTVRSLEHSDYFFNGSIQVLGHNILDLAQWYADDNPYLERVQLMFRSNPIPHPGYADQYTHGGGPAAVANKVILNGSDGTSDAALEAGRLHRLGHLQALQRATRAPDGTIVPQRVDGPGFDAMDVPDGSLQPKLHFSAFLPSAQNFAKARLNAGAPDLVPSVVPDKHNGIEPFMTNTRRQNFLCPPRKHRAFPLLELN